MSIIKILADKNIEDSAKLEQVAEIVAKARKDYGNTKDVVKASEVNTPYGVASFDSLLDDAKVHYLSGEVQRIRAAAIEFGKGTEGANVNKKLEELIATNPMFCNIVNKSEYSYV